MMVSRKRRFAALQGCLAWPALQPRTIVEKECRRHQTTSKKECVFSVVAIDSFRVNHNFEGIPERRSKKQNPSEESTEFQLDNRQQKQKAIRQEGTQDANFFESHQAEEQDDKGNRNIPNI
jgi:hypothetical protein